MIEDLLPLGQINAQISQMHKIKMFKRWTFENRNQHLHIEFDCVDEISAF